MKLDPFLLYYILYIMVGKWFISAGKVDTTGLLWIPVPHSISIWANSGIQKSISAHRRPQWMVSRSTYLIVVAVTTLTLSFVFSPSPLPFLFPSLPPLFLSSILPPFFPLSLSFAGFASETPFNYSFMQRVVSSLCFVLSPSFMARYNQEYIFW